MIGGGERIRVAVADHAVTQRDRVRLILESRGFDVVGDAADRGGLTRLLDERAPDTLVLGDGLSGFPALEAIREIRARERPPRIVVLGDVTEVGVEGADAVLRVSGGLEALPGVLMGLSSQSLAARRALGRAMRESRDEPERSPSRPTRVTWIRQLVWAAAACVVFALLAPATRNDVSTAPPLAEEPAIVEVRPAGGETVHDGRELLPTSTPDEAPAEVTLPTGGGPPPSGGGISGSDGNEDAGREDGSGGGPPGQGQGPPGRAGNGPPGLSAAPGLGGGRPPGQDVRHAAPGLRRRHEGRTLRPGRGGPGMRRPVSG